jgi:hypothetical protein
MSFTRVAAALDLASRGLFALLAGIALLSLGFVLLLQVKGCRAGHELARLPVADVRAVVLEPVPRYSRSLVQGVRTIRDSGQVQAIARLVRDAQPERPNHPGSQWTVILHLELPDREITGQVTSTYGQGVLFYHGLGPDGGIVLGTYRADELGPLLERIAAAAPR